ncbi:MAG: hypothetical protein ACYTFX_10600 [Planctomycetota bacterium]|jgi:hypothetical protein
MKKIEEEGGFGSKIKSTIKSNPKGVGVGVGIFILVVIIISAL